MSVTVIIPAHNEEAGIVKAIESLSNQTLRPDSIIVVADNCTDQTVSLARDTGATVIETLDNEFKKAGAINQALDYCMPTLLPDDGIIIMDADTALSPNFIEVSREMLGGEVGGVGGAFYCREEKTWLQVMQANEYARYVREIARKKAKANVLTGAGSMFLVKALREVREARQNKQLPNSGFYDVTALTEDNEMTLALKTLGYKCLAPEVCEIYTDAPEGWRGLYDQRIRWRRGAMQNLTDYGWSKTTFPYIIKTFWTAFVTVVTALYVIALLAGAFAGYTDFSFHPLWTGIFGLYWIERVWTVRNRAHGRVVALLLLPELFYDLFQQVIFVGSCVKHLRKTEAVWIH